MLRSLIVLPLLSMLAVSCGAPLPDADPLALDEEGRGDQDGPCVEGVYPCGPYGYLPSAVIRNLTLPGLRDRNLDGSLLDESTETLSLSDYFVEKGYKAIVITSSAEWCDPCKLEQAGLKKLYNDYQGTENQVAIFEALIEDNLGAPATIEVAKRWAEAYGINFDLTIDPKRALGPYYDINAFPMNMVVRTSDMKIVWQKNGLAEGELRQAVEQAIAGQ